MCIDDRARNLTKKAKLFPGERVFRKLSATPHIETFLRTMGQSVPERGQAHRICKRSNPFTFAESPRKAIL